MCLYVILALGSYIGPRADMAIEGTPQPYNNLYILYVHMLLYKNEIKVKLNGSVSDHNINNSKAEERFIPATPKDSY